MCVLLQINSTNVPANLFFKARENCEQVSNLDTNLMKCFMSNVKNLFWALGGYYPLSCAHYHTSITYN